MKYTKTDMGKLNLFKSILPVLYCLQVYTIVPKYAVIEQLHVETKC